MTMLRPRYSSLRIPPAMVNNVNQSSTLHADSHMGPRQPSDVDSFDTMFALDLADPEDLHLMDTRDDFNVATMANQVDGLSLEVRPHESSSSLHTPAPRHLDQCRPTAHRQLVMKNDTSYLATRDQPGAETNLLRNAPQIPDSPDLTDAGCCTPAGRQYLPPLFTPLRHHHGLAPVNQRERDSLQEPRSSYSEQVDLPFLPSPTQDSDPPPPMPTFGSPCSGGVIRNRLEHGYISNYIGLKMRRVNIEAYVFT